MNDEELPLKHAGDRKALKYYCNLLVSSNQQEIRNIPDHLRKYRKWCPICLEVCRLYYPEKYAIIESMK